MAIDKNRTRSSTKSQARKPKTGTRGKRPVNRKGTARKSKRTLKQRLIRFGLKTFGLLIFAGIFAFFAMFLMVRIGVFGPIPTQAQLKQIKNPVASEVYSADGKLLGRYYIQNRSDADFSEFPAHLIHALVATEDARFYEHQGIDKTALLRVLVKSVLLMDRSAGGGSTLSQQVAKNIYGRKDYGIFSMPAAKIRESIIAYRLEQIYTKDEILELYLNTVPFGENTFGVATAAERFFSKKPKQLNVSESASLVGMLKANTTYNPRLHPKKATTRRNVVINQMIKEGYLTKEEGEKWKATPLETHYKYLVYNTGPAAYFRERIRPTLESWCEENKKDNGDAYDIYVDGLRIYTTIDAQMQQDAEEAVKKHMSALQKVFDEHWKGKNPVSSSVLKRAVELSPRYEKLKKAGKSNDQIQKIFNTPVEMRMFTWEGEKKQNITPMDSVKYALSLLHTGMLAMNPLNGDVKVWIGGDNFEYFQYDHVTATRQVGSVFKPLVYATALEQGMEPDAYISNEREVYTDYQNWSPSNSDGNHEGYYSMEGALANSVNTIAVKVLMEAGIDEVIETAKRFGISSTLPEVPSLALGVADISLLEMIQAYCVFANEGFAVTPRMITRIEDAQGNVLEEFTPEEPVNVYPEEQARIMNHYLQAVVDSGTSTSLRSVYGIKGDWAGKTGTTQNHADGWFIGFTPKLVVGAWTGADDPSVHFRTITYGQGAKMALPEVGLFLQQSQARPESRQQIAASFTPLSLEMREDLNQPHYRDKPEPAITIEKIKDIFIPEDLNPLEIFRSDPSKKEERKRRREERKKAREERNK